MKNYEELNIKIICFTADDIVTGSMTDPDGDGVYDGDVKEPENWG